MDMHPFRQIVTIKADAITVLNKHRWHG
jgi:hypothetical protein